MANFFVPLYFDILHPFCQSFENVVSSKINQFDYHVFLSKTKKPLKDLKLSHSTKTGLYYGICLIKKALGCHAPWSN